MINVKKYIERAGKYDGILAIENKISGDLSLNCKATIIIPTYNEKDNILNLLKNLTTLSGYSEGIFEVIIVDNNSTDNTVKLANEWIESNKVKNLYIVHELTKGVTAARRRGFDEAVLRYFGRQANAPFYILSADADNILDADWVINYLKCFKDSNKALLEGKSEWTYEEITNYPNITTFLKTKDTLESFIKNIYIGRAEGKNFGISVEAYAGVGGFETDYYYSGDKLYPECNDDWTFSAKVLDGGFSLGLSNSLVKVNTRKLIRSAENLKNGNIYLYNWNNLASQEASDKDFTNNDLDILTSQQIRGVIAYQMLMNIFIDSSFLKNDLSIDFLGAELTADINKYLLRTKEIFPKSTYNSYFYYFSPSCYLFLIFGKRIMERLPNRFPDIKFEYNVPSCFDEHIDENSPFWKKELIFSTYCRTYLESIGKYFGSWF